MTKRLPHIAGFLLADAIPRICKADGADAVNGLLAAIMLAKYLACWTLITAAVFFLLWLCKVSKKKRIVLSILFWISPIFLLDPAVKLYGDPGTHVIVQTEKPVVLAGATFPAGSRADYIHLGRGFWRRKLVEISGTRPVKFGGWDITRLQLDPPDGNVVYADLVRPEVIEGWPCDKAPSFELTSGPPRLHGCGIISSKKIADLDWWAGTFVRRAANDGWLLDTLAYGRRDKSKGPARAFGFPIDDMSATYNASYQLQTWTGTFLDDDVPIGNYVFPRYTKLTWQAPDRMVVEGSGKEQKTGIGVRCVLVQLSDRSTHPCEKASAQQEGQTQVAE